MKSKTFEIYIIGGENGRCIKLKDQLESLDFEFLSVPGVFYSDFPDYFNAKRSQVLSRTKLTLRELGCARAHLNVYEDVLTCGYTYAVIFEDDALIDNLSTFSELITIFERDIPMDKPLVLSLFTRSAILSDRLTNKLDKYDLFRVINSPSSTLCYFINRKACEILRDANQFGDWVSDWPQSNLIDYQIILPTLVKHDESHESLIGDERYDRRRRGIYRAKVLLFEFLLFNYFLYGLRVLPFSVYLRLVYKPRIIWWSSFLRSRQVPGQVREIRYLKSMKLSYLGKHDKKSNLI